MQAGTSPETRLIAREGPVLQDGLLGKPDPLWNYLCDECDSMLHTLVKVCSSQDRRDCAAITKNPKLLMNSNNKGLFPPHVHVCSGLYRGLLHILCLHDPG